MTTPLSTIALKQYTVWAHGTFVANIEVEAANPTEAIELAKEKLQDSANGAYMNDCSTELDSREFTEIIDENGKSVFPKS
jgi:hypothetical protein